MEIFTLKTKSFFELWSIHEFTIISQTRLSKRKILINRIRVKPIRIFSFFYIFRCFSQYPVSLPSRASFPSSLLTLSLTSAGTANEYGVPGSEVR